MLRLVRCVVACCRWESCDPVQEQSGSSPVDSSLQSRQEVVSSSSADCAEMVESFCFSVVERCRSLRDRPERTAHEEGSGLSQELTTLQVVSISDDILSTEQSVLETEILIGCVSNTWDGFVYISETIYFSLDIISEGFVPYKGDWLEVEYSMEPCTSNIRAHSAKPMNCNHIKE
ncbi:cancer/testis antigen 55-like [Ochotona princeps]|nr:cancer/testis antigen 55-like [Ochotona princeps]